MIKRLHVGLAAAHGVLTMQLVESGFDGPADGLGGDLGFLEVFGGDDIDRAQLVVGLGQKMIVTQTYVKPFASCAIAHCDYSTPKDSASQLAPQRTPCLDEGRYASSCLPNANSKRTPRTSLVFSTVLMSIVAESTDRDQPNWIESFAGCGRGVQIMTIDSAGSICKSGTIRTLCEANFEPMVQTGLIRGLLGRRCRASRGVFPLPLRRKP